MKLHLYDLDKAEAFKLSIETLNELGFIVHLADEAKGIISSGRQNTNNTDVLFFNVLFSEHMPYATLTLISNIFAGASGTFIAVKNCEEEFCEALQKLIKNNNLSNNHLIAEEITLSPETI